eukprot:scaffold25265_cov122-Cylindrotheca_fusiformis.AAC.2
MFPRRVHILCRLRKDNLIAVHDNFQSYWRKKIGIVLNSTVLRLRPRYEWTVYQKVVQRHGNGNWDLGVIMLTPSAEAIAS